MNSLQGNHAPTSLPSPVASLGCQPGVEPLPGDVSHLQMGHLSYRAQPYIRSMRGYLVRPRRTGPKPPSILVLHDSCGLTRRLEEVTRQLGHAGFLAFVPDASVPIGGYSLGDGRENDFAAAAQFLHSHWAANGTVDAWIAGQANTDSLATMIREFGGRLLSGRRTQYSRC